ncbi:M949_RS01915 family surface polysaccharide biosynthesis protein [Parasediminibacterium sp. JCM 36343]|uniref:M949_RS01915 family surface polysaccharide biosynthesis protein n=1 Tax=Parasediminibacterium sp. JCM 36343 TaxID=3374279 RepID=UPI00397A5591
MKLTIIIILLTFTNFIYGQLTIAKIDSAKLPKEIKYSGHITNSVKWTDNLGINYVLTTATGEYLNKNNENDNFKSAALYAYHYILKDDSLKLLWKIYDFNKDCDFDLYLRFIDNTFKVTDLDKNGIAEVWVMYENQCTSDVSPAPTKIIMYEGNKKYAVRGENKVKISEKEFIGGQYNLDNNFKNGNPLFRQFAIDLWKKNELKKW